MKPYHATAPAIATSDKFEIKHQFRRCGPSERTKFTRATGITLGDNFILMTCGVCGKDALVHFSYQNELPLDECDWKRKAPVPAGEKGPS